MPSARVWITASRARQWSFCFLGDWGELRRVRVHDVGQGNGNALIVRAAQDEPVLYFDLGCGALWNRRTKPAQLRYDLRAEPWIILSHWDFDHWWAGFNDHWEEARQCEWLAPRQKISPMHQRLASDLGNKLRLWPNFGASNFRRSMTAITGSDRVEISRCNGPADGDRNDSGLAITIVKSRRGQRRRLLTPDLVLLPGDAPYNCIAPTGTRGDWVGIVATHHGSRTNLVRANNRPIAELPQAEETQCPVIVYSAGVGNVYGHPDQVAVTAYGEKRWQTNLNSDRRNGKYSYRYDTAVTQQNRGDQEISFEFT